MDLYNHLKVKKLFITVLILQILIQTDDKADNSPKSYSEQSLTCEIDVKKGDKLPDDVQDWDHYSFYLQKKKSFAEARFILEQYFFMKMDWFIYEGQLRFWRIRILIRVHISKSLSIIKLKFYALKSVKLKTF